MAKKQVIVIGAGFAGLAAACCLAKDGFGVTVLEKNDQLGGRARVWEKDGFRFDLGPSWYWMPDVFTEFFARFGKTPADYYDLVRLDPGYRVFFKNDTVDIPADRGELTRLFEQIEPGAGAKLTVFLADAAYKYNVGMSDYVRRPSLSAREFFDVRLIREALRLQMLSPLAKTVRALFRDERLVRILEFPVLFLGGTAAEIPAMYSLMNHADLTLGTWYPMGGMGKVVDALVTLATELGVVFRTSAPVSEIVIENGQAVGVRTVADETWPADAVIAAADYHHVEQQLLASRWRMYDEAYWESRTLSPSSLLFYLGVNRRLPNLQHHNLFFDELLPPHADAIYKTPEWPNKPLFYVCCPSQTDTSVAPSDRENLFVLVPLAPDLADPESVRERLYDAVMTRLEARVGVPVRPEVIVKRSYAHREFIADYHAYKGNAYGLANTLAQTAIFKPRMQSRKVQNLFFAGQLTVPGPGVPPSLISGQMAAGLVSDAFIGSVES